MRNYTLKDTKFSYTYMVTSEYHSLYCFPAVNDDLCYDAVCAAHAVKAVEEWLDKKCPIVYNVIHISDRAAVHFKNWYRLH